MLASDRYEKGLATAGFDVGKVDYVLCTHLHIDHVGWNTRLENGRWVPTFPNAKYVFAGRELEHWTERHKADPTSLPWITDSVLPIIEANRVELVTPFEFVCKRWTTDMGEWIISPVTMASRRSV
jgi:glyoxylase-like metal-dependent hydrolase (beta-lactamase superfamily II)